MQGPASTVQQQMWLLHRMYPRNSAYNIPALFRIRGEFRPAALAGALRTVVARHGILRTTFRDQGGQLRQVVHETLDPDLDLAGDLASIPALDEDETEAWVRESIGRPFDLERGPLLRAACRRAADGSVLLVITLHHIITDLRSKDRFAAELAEAYARSSGDGGAPTGESGIPAPSYLQVTRSDHEFQASERHERMLDFWRDQVARVDGALDLPRDRARPAVLELDGAARPLRLDPQLVGKLDAFSRERGTRTYQTLLTAYAVLLHRTTGRTLIPIGVPLTNRRAGERKEVLGCLMNIVPVLVDLDGSPDFDEALRRVKRAMLLAHRNQEVWFRTIVERCDVPRDPAVNPVFQVGFTFEHPMRLALDGLEVETAKIHAGGAQLDLFGVFWQEGDHIDGYFEYSTALFSAATVDRFADNWVALLNAVAGGAAGPVARIEVLSADERRLLLREWNDTGREFDPARTFLHHFARRVEETPGAIAVRCGGESLDYASLAGRASALAEELGRLGAAPGSLVGIHLERSIEMLVCVLAVAEAGCAWVPLDPHFPSERLRYMVELAAAPLVLTHSRLSGELPETAGTIRCVDELESAAGPAAAGPKRNRSRGEDLAYVIFTSGSTGRPKGVMVPHAAVTNFLLSMGREPGLEAGQSLLAVTSLSFDISVLELLLPLTRGATVVLARSEDVVDGARLSDLIRRHAIDVMQATPVTWRLLLETDPAALRGLKVLCGGEAMPAELAERLLAEADQVWNMYGPTETTVWSTCHRLGPGEEIGVGRPIDNTQAYLLNREGGLVPRGAVGELWIGGAGVARGYFKRPDLTREVFVESRLPGLEGTLYRTGDLARWRTDGTLEVLGRIDHQVKIRGYRIELGEIEAVLEAQPEVDQAVVTTAQREPGGPELVAYFVSASGAQGDPSRLRAETARALPEYMVPATFVELPAMPLTPNGKVDRKALPAPSFTREAARQEFVAPGTELQRQLAAVWREVLQVDRVGLHDRFFEIGGNSLTAVQVVARIGEKLGRELTVVSLFRHPTLEALALHLETDGAERGAGNGSDPRAEQRARGRRERMARLRNRRKG